METMRLGRTNLTVSRTAFGALPIQRTEMDEAVRILRAAYDGGITFFDTARAYTDSEEKIGRALSDVRDSIVIATKSTSMTRSGVLADLETSLRMLRTDHVDILQLHNPRSVPGPEDSESAYAALIEAREKGMTRFIGMTNHSRERSIEAVDSGLYDTLQYPISHICGPEDLAVVERARAADIAVIGMKALSGGLITNVSPAFAFLRQYQNLIPIWGVQRMGELEEILALESNPPSLDDETWAIIERDRRELAGEFCRACGYCLPCPQEIPIPMAARMGLLLRRMPYQEFMSDQWYAKMHLTENCTGCGECRSRCPYGLDPASLLKKALADYEAFYQDYKGC